LGLLSKRVPETTTTRTFEIPATGVFMLAERTEDHLSLFKEGVEAEYFGNDEELKDKMRFYLKHDELRRKVAAAGRERCVRSGYDSRSQLVRVLDLVDAVGH
jgi:spore maturation protein CgeB